MSYDVSSLLTNVPLEETIQILRPADKAFTNHWFNETHHLNLSIMDLVDFLRASTKDQLFQFNGQLYEQTDGVPMGSLLGPLLANVFMGSIAETLEREGKMPSFYNRYVDDKKKSSLLHQMVNCLSAICFTFLKIKRDLYEKLVCISPALKLRNFPLLDNFCVSRGSILV